VKRLRAQVGGLFSLTLPHGSPQKVSYGDLGVEIDKARLAQLLRDSVDHTSPLSRWRRRNDIASTAPLQLPVPLRIDVQRALPLLLSIKDEFDRPSVDARLDLERRQVTSSVEGMLLDVDASLRAIEQALGEGASAAALVFEKVAPRRHTEQLADVRFDHVLASFETPYDRAMKAAARTFNL